MNEDNAFSESKVSKYNQGMFIVARLDELWKKTHLHASNHLFSALNDDLDRVWCEIARNLKEDTDFKTKKEEFDKINGELVVEGSFQDFKPAGWNKVDKSIEEKRRKQYNILMKKELFLRRLENFLGLGNKWDDESSDDMD